MVCLEVKAVAGTIADVSLSGDFFLHPEETVDRIESRLKGMPSDASESDLSIAIESCLSESEARLIGASAQDIAKLLRKAVDSCAGE